jgi:hypothetical protein
VNGGTDAFDRALYHLVQDDAAVPPADLAGTVYGISEAAKGQLQRHELTGDPDAARAAVAGFAEAARLIPGGSRFVAGSITDLLTAQVMLYAATGGREILDDIVRTGREGVAAEERDSVAPDIAVQTRVHLCGALVQRAEFTGSLPDIDDAIRVGLGAVQLPARPDLAATAMVNTARASLMRVDRLHETEDLARATGLVQAVLSEPRLPADLSGWAALLFGDCLVAMEDDPPRGANLDELLGTAVACFESAADRLADPEFAAFASFRAARTLAHRAIVSYQLDKRPESGWWQVSAEHLVMLDEAIRRLGDYARSASDRRRAGALNSLAGALRDRGMITSNADDLSAAIRAQADAAHLSLPDTPERAAAMANLGRQAWELWRNVTHDPQTLVLAAEAAAEAERIAFASFLDETVATRFADSGTWEGMRSRLVHSCAVLSRELADESWAIQAVEHAEAAKAALLRAIVGRGDVAPPPGLPGAELSQEHALLRELTEIDRQGLSAAGTGTEESRRRAAVIRGLQELWASWEGGAQLRCASPG